MEYYIQDVLDQLIAEAERIKNTASSEFDKGKLWGYYESISKLLNQAEAFDISKLLPTRLRDFNPEDLIG